MADEKGDLSFVPCAATAGRLAKERIAASNHITIGLQNICLLLGFGILAWLLLPNVKGSAWAVELNTISKIRYGELRCNSRTSRQSVFTAMPSRICISRNA